MRLLPEIRNLIGNYHVKSGVYHYYRNEHMQAVDFLRKALRDESQLTDSDTRKARHYLTLALMDSSARQVGKGDMERAITELKIAAEVSPHFPDIHLRLGQLLEQQDQTESAIEQFVEAIRHNADYLEAHIAMGFCLMGLKRSDEAATVFKNALAIKQRKQETPFAAGLAALASGDQEQARESLHEVFLAARQLSVEHVKAAQNLLRAEDFEAALAEFDRAAALNPKYPDVHNYRGIALCELGRLDEALEAFGVSASLSPEYLVPRLNLAFGYVRAGDLREAETALEEVLKIDPSETAATAKLEELRSVRVPEKRRPVTRGTVR